MGLSIYICGEAGDADWYNPFFVAERRGALDLLRALAAGPAAVDELARRLGMDVAQVRELAEAWLRIDAVREEGGRYRLNMPLFLREDDVELDRASEEVARRIADEVWKRRRDIAAIAERIPSSRYAGVEKVLFAAVGAYALDLSGLEALEGEGVVACMGRERPGGRRYALFARERWEGLEALIDGLYWGMHSTRIGSYVYVTFGDHAGRRYAFPDLIGVLSGAAVRGLEGRGPPELVEAVPSYLLSLHEELLDRVGDFLMSLNHGPAPAEGLKPAVLRLLIYMGYVKAEGNAVTLNVPAFRQEDQDAVAEIVRLVTPMATAIFREHRDALLERLRNMTPLKHGASTAEVMTEVWHWVFGKVNRELARRGLLYNPPKRPGEARYMPWLSQFTLT